MTRSQSTRSSSCPRWQGWRTWTTGTGLRSSTYTPRNEEGTEHDIILVENNIGSCLRLWCNLHREWQERQNGCLKIFCQHSSSYGEKSKGGNTWRKRVQLFNLLTGSFRNMKATTLDMFKRGLDIYFSTIQEQPTVKGLQRAAETNSLLHQNFMKTDK